MDESRNGESPKPSTLSRAEMEPFLDKALEAVNRYILPRDRESVREELFNIAVNYLNEIEERTSGRVAEVAKELETLEKCAHALAESIFELTKGAKHILNERRNEWEQKLWEQAECASLDPEEFLGLSHLSIIAEDGSGMTAAGPWYERVNSLAYLAGSKARDCREIASNVGRKTLDDCLRGETSQDWLLRACAGWLDYHSLEPTKRIYLARLIHEAATGEKPTAGQFREAGARAKD